MDGNVDNMNIMQYIQQRIPAAESVLDATAWFADEEMILDFGEYAGRPSANAMMHTSLLTYFLANGWKVVAVLSQGEGGEWQSTAEATSMNQVNANSKTYSESYADGEAESESYVDEGGGPGSADTTRATSSTHSEGDTTSEGESTSLGTASSSSTSGGAPYWCAYIKVKLRRRKMQSERVLRDMITSFTNAYNEGRTVNNARYDELVALYALMLTHTEDELNTIPLSLITEDDFKALSDQIADVMRDAITVSPADIRDYIEEAIRNVREAISDFKQNATPIPAEWFVSRVNEINRKFDNLIATNRAKMVADNTYNGSVWTNVESGVERDRQYALTDLADTMVTLKVDTYAKIADQTANSEIKLADILAKIKNLEMISADVNAKIAGIRADLLKSASAIIDGIQKRRIDISTLRNTVLKWMFDFMERRDDDYPGLEQLATIAERLGYSDGAVGGALST